MSHYYSQEVDLPSDEHEIIFDYHHETIKFIGDNGVFSKNYVDFGSRCLLETIEVDEKTHTLLDIGCGYGTLGVSLKKVYPFLRVDMTDVNERALYLANKAVSINHLDGISVYPSDIYDNISSSFDMIVSNPPIRAGKKVVFGILEGAYCHLNDNGSLWIVVQKKQGAPSAKKKMTEVFGNCTTVSRNKGYYILKSIKKAYC